VKANRQGGGQSRNGQAEVPLSLELPKPHPGVHRLLSQCDPVANGVDTSLLEHVSPIEWDNVVLYGQYILTGSSSGGAVRQKGPLLAYKIT